MSENNTISKSTIEAYTLLPPEMDFLVRRRKGNRLAQAVLLKYVQENGRCPSQPCHYLKSRKSKYKQKRAGPRTSPFLIEQVDPSMILFVFSQDFSFSMQHISRAHFSGTLSNFCDTHSGNIFRYVIEFISSI